MKYTKQIEIINVYGEQVTIKPVEYKMAIEVIELMEEHALLTDKMSNLFVKFLNEGMDGLEIKKDKNMIELMEKSDILDKKEREMRDKNNYWYHGLDNLDVEDRVYLENKYPRRKNIG